MHIITGGTGHVGSALAEVLLAKKEKVTIVSRSSKDARQWMEKGAEIAVADVYDTQALHEIFKTGKSIFLLNPPADPLTNTALQEKKTATSLIQAVKNSGAEKIVVESTMGSRAGDNIGDLGVLFELEQAIAKLPCLYSIIRPAYYMTNWTEALPMIKEKGEIVSFYPANLKFPMVAPKDIGALAARLMMEKNTLQLNTLQGPEMYSASDVAAALTTALGKQVKVKVVPKEQWVATYQSMGFSKEAAVSYAQMTAISLDEFNKGMDTTCFLNGTITLQQFINDAVKVKN